MAVKFTDIAINTLFTPEDYGGQGYATMAAAIAAGFDNTTAMQALADDVITNKIRACVPELFYRCNSTVNIAAHGEFVCEGSIVTPNTDINAVRLYGVTNLPFNHGSRTIISVENNVVAGPLWLGKTYPPIFDNTYSPYLATLGTWLSTRAYVHGDEVQHLGIGYRAKTSTTGNTPASSPTQWAPFSLAITDGGGQTMLQRLAAETNIGVLIDSMGERSIEVFSSGYAIGIAVKPRTDVYGPGSASTAWCHVKVHASQQNKVGLAIICGGPTAWVNECSFDINNLAIQSGFVVNDGTAAGAKGLYGAVLMNDDTLGNYWPNGNRFTGVDMEYADAIGCSEFCQIVIHKGFHNKFENTRADASGTRTVKFFRHPVIGDNPNHNAILNSTRIQSCGAVNNGYENRIEETGEVDVLSLQFSMNDLGNRLVYSGSDKAMIRGLGFWTGTAFTRFESSQFCYKHYDTGRILVFPNARPGVIVYPGTRKYNSYWTVSMRSSGALVDLVSGARFSFQCYNAAGAIIGQAGATPAAPLIQNSTIWFTETTFGGQPIQQTLVDLDDSNPFKHALGVVPITFHEVVDKAVFMFYGTKVEGFELRAYNSPGARVSGPASYTEENVVISPPQKGQYTRPWRAMYEDGANDQCILDVGSSAVPTSWATSGVWAGSGSSTLREERHVVSGTDYRVYRCSVAGTVGAAVPTGVVYGVEEMPVGGTSKWQFMGVAEQIAAFVDV